MKQQIYLVLGGVLIKRLDSINIYKVFDDYVVFYITNRKKEKFEVKFSLCDLNKVLELDAKVYVFYNKCTDSYYARATKYLGMTSNGKSKNKCINMTTYIMDITDSKRDVVDHLNHDTLDNRRDNLRVTTITDNSKYRKGKNTNNKSGYRNVCWLKDQSKYVVQLMVNGKNQRLGFFTDVEEAAKFAEQMREKHYGEFAGNA